MRATAASRNDPGTSPHLRNVIEPEVTALVERWPARLRDEFRHYRKRLVGTSRHGAIMAEGELPCWLMLPYWLSEHYAGSAPDSRERPFLRDAVIGQYLLFLAVRIEDDVLDRQCRSRTLFEAAHRLHLEAERLYARHFTLSSRFWPLFYDLLSETREQIRLVDLLQRSPRTSPRSLTDAYAGVNAIFCIGAASVCIYHGHREDVPSVKAFSERCAAATQLLDDLADIREDLSRHRWNYAAIIAARKAGADAELGAIAAAPIAVELLGRVRSGVDDAFRSLAHLRLAPAERYRKRYRQSLGTMRDLARIVAHASHGAIHLDLHPAHPGRVR